MPLISHGSFDAFCGIAGGPASTEYEVTGPQPFAALREVTRALQPLPTTFVPSPRPVRTRIADITLTSGSRSMLRRVLDPDAGVQVMAWCWDLSGDPPAVVPADSTPADWRLELAGTDRALAAGELPLWPGRQVVGGLAVRIILWQGTHPTLPAEVAEAVRHSRLASVLATIAGSGSTTITSAVMAREAAAGLGPEVAPVLRALCPDYVDFFEGFFPATGIPDGVSKFTGYHSRLVLSWGG